eukprot:141326-Hanusia_phi.AAC.2
MSEQADAWGRQAKLCDSESREVDAKSQMSQEVAPETCASPVGCGFLAKEERRETTAMIPEEDQAGRLERKLASSGADMMLESPNSQVRTSSGEDEREQIKQVLGKLREASKETQTCRYELEQLCKLAHDVCNHKEIQQAGGIKAVLEAMQEHHEDLEIQEKGLEVLSQLDWNQQETGHVKTVLGVMREYRQDEKVQGTGLQVLQKISIENEKWWELNAGGGIEAVVEAIRAHRKNCKVQAKGMFLLSAIARGQEGQKAIWAAGGAEAFILHLQGMLANDNSWTIESSLKHLMKKIEGGNVQTKEVLAAGGIKELLLVIVRCSPWGYESFLDDIISLLSSLVTESNKGEPADTSFVVLETMREYHNDTQVQRGGLKLLLQIANKDIEEERDDCRTLRAAAWKIRRAGGAGASLAAMKEHGSCKEVQILALHLLGRLSESEEGQRVIREAGGVKIILAAIQEHKNNDNAVQRAGFRLLAMVSWKEEGRREVLAAGGVEAALSALDFDPNYPEYLFSFLCWMETEEENRLRGLLRIGMPLCSRFKFRKGDMVILTEATLRAMQRHPGDLRVQRAGLNGLASEGTRKAGPMIIREAGGVKTVIAAMREHSEDTSVQSAGLTILKSIFQNDEDGRREIRAAGGVEIVLAAMHGAKNGQTEGILLLLNFLSEVEEQDQNRKDIQNAGAVDVALSALKQCSTGLNILNNVERILPLLSGLATVEINRAPPGTQA